MDRHNLIAILAFFVVPLQAMELEEPDITRASTVTPETVKIIMDSYKEDSGNFAPEQKLVFAEREYFKELDLLNQIFFPRFWNQPDLPGNQTLLQTKLMGLAGIMAGSIAPYVQNQMPVNKIIKHIIDKLPAVRNRLKEDVEAAHAGDPAAKQYAEIIRCYPGFLCMVVQRVAHELYNLKVPVYPRELTELAHRLTGIDIHPGAAIGDHFFIDHGTGTVIGETCTIGNWCRLYQGVTLGALHFQQGKDSHMLKKDYKRHPTLGNNVVIGAGAKILGNIVIGDHVNIGANCWVQTDIAPNRTVYIEQHPKQIEKERKTPH